jgi:hypothetical protein
LHVVTTSDSKVGLTTNSAPLLIAACAVSLSSTVPAPTIASDSENEPDTSASNSIASGLSAVISKAVMPPAASASATSMTVSASAPRITATTPLSTKRCRSSLASSVTISSDIGSAAE